MRLAIIWVALAAGAWLAVVQPSAAGEKLPEGKKVISLMGTDGAVLNLGAVTFTPDGDGALFQVSLDAPQFQDAFLSMRPFRCLAGTKETWCHLQYPYETKGRITADDLVDLEYAFLFLTKAPGGYGIDAWNGLYFKLGLDGAGGVSGLVHDVDLNVLAVPPADRAARVVRHQDLHAAEPGAHAYGQIEIR